MSPRARIVTRAAAIAVFALGAAGCSDSGRFEVNNPFNYDSASRPQQDVTGSVSRPASTAPASRISKAPLPAPSAPQTVAANSGVSQGAGGLGAYRPSQPQHSQDITGSVAAPVSGHWTWEGGTPVVVGSEDSVEAIGRKYGVPASAIIQANNISDPSAIRPGQRLVIPRYVSSATASSARPQPAPAHSTPSHVAPAVASVQSTPAASDNVHVVAPGETLMAVSRKYHVSLTTLAKANNIQPFTKVAIGDRLTIPGKRVAPTQQAKAPQTVKPQASQQVAQRPAQVETKVASASPTAPVATVPATENARVATQGPDPQESSTKTAEPTGAMPSFRWPVHGRVISAFGSRTASGQNDGINLAVPEGTPVKAAEDGVVAYAGNELKGYGNLVLVRHSNGYVSAYANASELMVKRGDSVKRGQTIARAGQTDNVSSPQLHFEIRKGSTPVDPSKYLTGASNG
jgi:murein DD-endopeptidase MepM/ murein hydrolase activator NlpD